MASRFQSLATTIGDWGRLCGNCSCSFPSLFATCIPGHPSYLYLIYPAFWNILQLVLSKFLQRNKCNSHQMGWLPWRGALTTGYIEVDNLIRGTERNYFSPTCINEWGWSWTGGNRLQAGRRRDRVRAGVHEGSDAPTQTHLSPETGPYILSPCVRTLYRAKCASQILQS